MAKKYQSKDFASCAKVSLLREPPLAKPEVVGRPPDDDHVLVQVLKFRSFAYCDSYVRFLCVRRRWTPVYLYICLGKQQVEDNYCNSALTSNGDWIRPSISFQYLPLPIVWLMGVTG